MCTWIDLRSGVWSRRWEDENESTSHLPLSLSWRPSRVVFLTLACRRPFHARYRTQLLIRQWLHLEGLSSNGTLLNLEMRFWMETKLRRALSDAQTSEPCRKTPCLFPCVINAEMWPEITLDSRPHVCYFMCGSCVPPGTLRKLNLNLSIWFGLPKLCPLLFLDEIQSTKHIKPAAFGPRYLPELSVSHTQPPLSPQVPL